MFDGGMSGFLSSSCPSPYVVTQTRKNGKRPPTRARSLLPSPGTPGEGRVRAGRGTTTPPHFTKSDVSSNPRYIPPNAHPDPLPPAPNAPPPPDGTAQVHRHRHRRPAPRLLLHSTLDRLAAPLGLRPPPRRPLPPHHRQHPQQIRRRRRSSLLRSQRPLPPPRRPAPHD